MRIISGIYKGRTLKSPSVKNDIRPTTDRARETLFNILSNRIDFENKICLDLFCGTGSFGLEFISRGGSKCTFVDSDTKVIKDNVLLLDINERTSIIRNDAIKYLLSCKENKFDIVFADPPYRYKDY
ncbi:MAG: RsmD family RNA methyltransferase, partial [Ignavibacteria bacterium]